MPARLATFSVFANALLVWVVACVRLTVKFWMERPRLTLSEIGALRLVFAVSLPRFGKTLSACVSLRRYCTCAVRMTLVPRAAPGPLPRPPPPPPRPPLPPKPPKPGPGPPRPPDPFGPWARVGERFWINRRLTASDEVWAVVDTW